MQPTELWRKMSRWAVHKMQDSMRKKFKLPNHVAL